MSCQKIVIKWLYKDHFSKEKGCALALILTASSYRASGSLCGYWQSNFYFDVKVKVNRHYCLNAIYYRFDAFVFFVEETKLTLERIKPEISRRSTLSDPRRFDAFVFRTTS